MCALFYSPFIKPLITKYPITARGIHKDVSLSYIIIITQRHFFVNVHTQIE